MDAALDYETTTSYELVLNCAGFFFFESIKFPVVKKKTIGKFNLSRNVLYHYIKYIYVIQIFERSSSSKRLIGIRTFL